MSLKNIYHCRTEEYFNKMKKMFPDSESSRPIFSFYLLH